MKRIGNHVACVFAALALALAVGCSTPVLKLTMDVPGEFKLSDISKIAIVDFNALPDDPFGDAVAADAEMCGIVQRAVSAALARSHTWEVARFDVEQAVASFNQGVIPTRRFDAIAYGRVWWQFPPESDLMKPTLFNLETKTRVKYQVKVPVNPAAALGSLKDLSSSLKNSLKGITGGSSAGTQTAPVQSQQEMKIVEREIDLTTKTEEVLEMVGNRSREAMLMVALSIYRVKANGDLDKLVDMFVASGQTFALGNGDFSSTTAAFGFGPDSARTPSQEAQEGATALPTHLSTLPSDMQAKLMLAVRAANEIGRQLAPHKAVRQVPYSFSDAKLERLLQNRAYDAAEQYALRSIRTAVGAEVAAKLAPLEAYGKPPYDVAPSPASDIDAVAGENGAAAAATIAAKRGCVEALFALAICQEARQRAEEALYTYRYVFGLDGSAAAAEGIARCYEAIGDSARIAEQQRSVKKAEKKTRLD